jgi:hypothetical protein
LLGSVVFWFLNEYWINPVVWPYFFKLNETQKFFIWSGIQFVETI